MSHAIEAFDIDTIIVIGHEKLHIDLSRLPLVQSLKLNMIRIPKSGGAVDLDDHDRETAHLFQVRTYFYGEPPLPPQISGLVGKMVSVDFELSPYSFQIPWSRLVVLRVGEENSAPSSALPLGSSKVLSPLRLTRVDPSGPGHVVRLLNRVLALVDVKPEDRIVPAKESEVKEEVKEEKYEKDGEIKQDGEGEKKGEGESEGEGEGEGEGGEGEGEAEDEDDEEVPFREEIGTREVMGFIVMQVFYLPLIFPMLT